MTPSTSAAITRERSAMIDCWGTVKLRAASKVSIDGQCEDESGRVVVFRDGIG